MGINGLYDLTRRTGGKFPDTVGARQFKVFTDAERQRASTALQFWNPPPATLLIHGSADTTIECDQSRLFAAAVRKAGGVAGILVHEGIEHWFFRPIYPEVYLKSAEAQMDFLIKHLEIKDADRAAALRNTKRSIDHVSVERAGG